MTLMFAKDGLEPVTIPDIVTAGFARVFASSILQEPPGDMPPGRRRARDVIEVWPHPLGIMLRPHRTVTIYDTPEGRTHPRFDALLVPGFAEWCEGLISKAAAAWQGPSSLSVEAFTTMGTVVAGGPHRDNVKVLIIAVMSMDALKIGETQISTPDGRIVYAQRLSPGMGVMVRDDLYRHTTLAFEPGNRGGERNTIVITLHLPRTYWLPDGPEPLGWRASVG